MYLWSFLTYGYSIELPNAAEVAIRGKLEHARRCLETAKTFFAAHQI